MSQNHEYEKEATAKWGSSKEYFQSKTKTRKYTKDDWVIINAEHDSIFKEFAVALSDKSGSIDTNPIVIKWQEHITKYFYDCTDEILLGLSEMYVADERFIKNIDKFGEGLTQVMCDAIRNYLR